MKKRVLAVLLTSVMLFGIAACGKKEPGTTATIGISASDNVSGESLSVGAEVEQFVNVDIPSISGGRETAVGLYNKYFEGGIMDSEEWLRSLEYEALPLYDTYLTKLAEFEYTTPEVQNLKNTFLQSSQLQRDAIQDVVNGIKNNDSELLTSAEDKINQSEELYKSYEESLQSICSSNNIKINGTIGTATDAE